MARKSRLSKAADAAKVLAEKATRRLEQPVDAARTVAGEALGAAAIAATGVREQLRTDVGGGSGTLPCSPLSQFSQQVWCLLVGRLYLYSVP